MSLRKKLTWIYASCLVAVVAYAGAPSYVWDGDGGSSWIQTIPNNWDPDGSYPGRSAAGDTATIAFSSSSNPVIVSGSVPNSVATILIDADAANAPVGLRIASGGSLTTSGAVTVRAEQTTSNDLDATLHFQSGGSFSPASLVFDGGDAVAEGEAIFDVDATLNISSTSVTMRYYSDIDVATGATLTVGNVFFGDTASFWAISDLRGAGTLTTGTVEIDSGSAASSVVTINGPTTTTGAVTVTASQSGDFDATLTYAAGSFTPSSLTLYGGTPASGSQGEAYFIIDASWRDSSSTVALTARGEAIVDADLGDTGYFGTVTIGSNGSYAGDLLITGGGTVNVSSLVLNVPSSGNSVFEVSGSTTFVRR